MALIAQRAYQMRAAAVQALAAKRKRDDDLFACGVGKRNQAPTAVSLSRTTVPEDLAVGLDIGTLTTTDADATDTFTYSITADPSNKFAISSDRLTLANALDYETATSHSVTVRSTDSAGNTKDQAFTITVEDVDEDEEPPIDPETVTPVFSGGFDVEPVFGKSNGKGKGQGKTNALASVVFSIGAVQAGTTYVMRTVADLSLLSNQGKSAFVGFIMKDGNSFHGAGLKGDGSTGEDPTTIEGNWNGLNSVAITDKGTNANGTQYTALSKITFSADASTYTYYTGTGSDPDTAVWTAEISNQAAGNIATLTDAETFGPAIFFPSNDVGQFSIEIDVWEVTIPAALDGLSPTGAWSRSRDLLTSFTSARDSLSGSDIISITDQTGNGRHMTDGGVSGRRPAATTAGPNSRECADFDGSTDFLDTASDLDNFIDGTSSFVIISCMLDAVTLNNAATYNNHCIIGDRSQFYGLYAKNVGGTTPTFLGYNWDGAQRAPSGGALATGTPYVVTLRFQQSNTTFYISVNGGAEVGASSNGTITLTGDLAMGLSGASTFLNGKIFEAATFATVPSLAQRNALIANFMDWVGA